MSIEELIGRLWNLAEQYGPWMIAALAVMAVIALVMFILFAGFIFWIFRTIIKEQHEMDKRFKNDFRY